VWLNVQANIPIRTQDLDYVCPEVLMRLRVSLRGEGYVSEESDWWSVGICAYEMLHGRTPRADASMVITYTNILHHKV